MNQNILQKAINTLKEIDTLINAEDVHMAGKVNYVLGMLETLYEMGNSSAVERPTVNRVIAGSNPASPAITDDASILDAKARAAIEQVKAMSEASKE